MAYEQKDNSASMFRNDKEGKSENFPDWEGSAKIGGVEYYVSAWEREGKSGGFFSLSFKPKAEAGKKAIKEAKAAVDDGFDQEIPF